MSNHAQLQVSSSVFRPSSFMPAKNQDLHGNVPDKADAALLIIDAINDLEFSGGEAILPAALEMARNISALKQEAKKHKIPTIYVNDNFGKWQSDFNKLIDHCIKDDTRGKEVVELILPDKDDYFVLKPKHSGFFSTTLDILLEYLKVKTLILAGLQTNICVLFTANEAYMRDFFIVAPTDCSASEQQRDHEYALEQMKKILKADIRPWRELDLDHLSKYAKEREEPSNTKPEQPRFRDTSI
jgi:nicotinamidase-related amidase